MTSYLDFGFSKFLEKPLFSGKSSGLKTRSQYSSGAFSNQLVGANVIDNKKTKYQYRAYKAVVDVSGNGDFKTIQEAIDYVHNIGYGTIFIKSGVYFEENLVFYSNITLLGEDNENTIIDFDEGDFFIQVTGSLNNLINNVFIKNLTIKNSRKVVPGGSGAVFMEYVKNSGVFNCKFSNNIGTGLNPVSSIFVTTSADRLVFANNYFDGDQHSITIFTGNNGNRIDVLQNDINNVSGNAIEIATSGTGINIKDNKISNSDRAIDIDGSSNLQIVNNIIDEFSSGINIAEDAACDSILVSGNRFINSIDSCNPIILYDGSNNIISNNIINNGSVGILLQNGDNNIIIGNSVTSCTTGIEISNPGANKNVVSSNNLVGNGTAFSDSGTSTTSVGNAS